ncbi:unknown [Eubacterium sp. CAG:786]|nr:unknown [Eubacterium sp. CAG:786]
MNVNGVLKEQFIIHANDAGVLRPIFNKKWEPPETLTWSPAATISSYSPSESGYKCSLITHDLSDGTYAMYVEFTLPDKFNTLVTVSPWDYTAWHAQSSAFDQTTGHVISSIEEAGTSLYSGTSLQNPGVVLTGGKHKLKITCRITKNLGTSSIRQTFTISLTNQGKM